MERYARQLDIPQIGPAGQEKLRAATVLVAGAGGLGSTALYCLCGAGVGQVRIVDGDTVSLSNLNRQFLHFVRDIGRSKLDSAAEKLRAFAPDCSLTLHHAFVDEDNAESLVRGADLVLAATDNLSSRLALNRACCRLGVPLVNGGVDGMYGTVQTVLPGQTACLRCLLPANAPEPATPDRAFAPVVSTISALMAQCALLCLLGQGAEIAGRLLCFDGLRLTLDTLPLARNPSCPVCGGAH